MVRSGQADIRSKDTCVPNVAGQQSKDNMMVFARRLWNVRIPVSVFVAAIVAVLTSISVLAYTAGYYPNIFYVGGTVNIFIVGNPEPTVTTANSYPIYNMFAVILPLMVASIAIITLMLRAKDSDNHSNVRGIVFTMALAIFLILMFLTINGVLNIFRG